MWSSELCCILFLSFLPLEMRFSSTVTYSTFTPFTHSLLICMWSSDLLIYTDEFLLSLLWAELNGPSSLSLSFRRGAPVPFINFMTLCWTVTSMSMSLLWLGAWNQAQCSRYDKCWTEGKGHLPWPAGSAAYDTVPFLWQRHIAS